METKTMIISNMIQIAFIKKVMTDDQKIEYNQLIKSIIEEKINDSDPLYFLYQELDAECLELLFHSLQKSMIPIE